MSLRIVFTPNAWQDYDGWLRRDMKMARRISKLIIECRPAGNRYRQARDAERPAVRLVFAPHQR